MTVGKLSPVSNIWQKKLILNKHYCYSAIFYSARNSHYFIYDINIYSYLGFLAVKLISLSLMLFIGDRYLFLDKVFLQIHLGILNLKTSLTFILSIYFKLYCHNLQVFLIFSKVVVLYDT